MRSLILIAAAAALLSFVGPGSSPAHAQATASDAALEANKALTRRFFEEVWSTGDLSRRDEFLAATYRGHLGGDQTLDREGWSAFFRGFREAFPDATFTVEDQVAEGDRVALRLTMRGTHLGPLNGLPPTGREVTVSGISIERVVDGRIVEGWNQNDALGMLQQLGALPAPPEAP